MAREIINLGTPPNGVDGDTIRTAMDKSNNNFEELYSKLGGFQNYIYGLIPRYSSQNIVTIGSGAAYIPSLGRIVEFPEFNISGLLDVNTWYHIYVFLSGSNVSGEIVSDAPVAYSGYSRIKGSDNSRRYIYSLKTDSTGSIIPFIVQTDGMLRYLIGNPVAPLRCLSNGKATTRTNVNLSGAIPITSIGALFLMTNTDTSLFANLSIPGASSQSIVGIAPGGANAGQFVQHPTSSTQMLDYFYSSTPANGLYIDVIGYTVER